jgi:chromosome segregation ATPase
MVFNVNPQLLKDFKLRKQQINDINDSCKTTEAKLVVLKEELVAMEVEWTDCLRGIISKISKSFEKSFANIGCAGQVQLNDTGEYSKWGIEIYVKFRAEEKMQLLTASRQSGGERSVSTMMYLLALQNLSASPFRVVDEINQGMDPRNERLVHRLIVQTTCATDNSQYFLITPKLLSNLEYHESMNVLCIMNGVWQPEKWSYGATFEKYIQH